MINDDYDSPWKEILERYFEQFMAFFFDAIHAEIDWARGYESLDSELQQIVRDAEAGKRLADKLMQVWRRDGMAQRVLVHIEVQGGFDSNFPERMLIYHYRLYDRYRRPIMSLAVLGDEHPNWRPDHYRSELWGCELQLRFPIIKLSDYQSQWEPLQESKNPFAMMVMAHLKTQATRNSPQERLRWKLILVKTLYERGYSRQDILELFHFIDWLLYLPNELAQTFTQRLIEYEATMSTPYITSVERLGIEKGIQQGIKQGIEQGIEQGIKQGIKQGIEQAIQAERTAFMRQIRRRFGDASTERLAVLLSQIHDPEQLADVGEWIVECDTGEALLERVRAIVDKH